MDKDMTLSQGIPAIAAIVFFTLPIFRSGGRGNLTGWEWVVNHTIFGPPVEYVPEEDYQAELALVEVPYGHVEI